MSAVNKQRLLSLCERKRFVRVCRGYPGEPQHNGFIRAVGEELILLDQYHDFYSEGVAALRIEDLESVRYGERERFFGSILIKEKLTAVLDLKVCLTNMHGLLRSLQENNCICILECQSRLWPDEDEYYIGHILSVQQNIIIFNCFNSLGIWDKAAQEIEIRKVTKCQMKTPYTDIMTRYLTHA